MKNPEICIIAALSENRVIGKDNKLPWRIPADLKRFRDLTIGHPVIMGRKTFESIGHPLPERTNIIITRDNQFYIDGCMRSHSLEEALLLAGQKDHERVFVIGGGQVFKQAISLVDRLYLTVVWSEFEGDTFFPDYSQFGKVVQEQIGNSGGYSYKFLELER